MTIDQLFQEIATAPPPGAEPTLEEPVVIRARVSIRALCCWCRKMVVLEEPHDCYRHVHDQ